MHALVRRNEHFVCGLNLERVVPGVGVSSRADDPKLARRMRIAHDLFPHIVVSDFSAPGLRPTEKHALVASVTVERWRRLAFE